MNIREILHSLTRNVIEPKTSDKILTPVEILELANSLPWKDKDAWRALREKTYAGEHDAATQKDYERYDDYRDIRDLLEQTRALKIRGDNKAPKSEKLWAEKIIQGVKNDITHDANTPLDKNEEHAVLVKGGKVYNVKNILLPK